MREADRERQVNLIVLLDELYMKVVQQIYIAHRLNETIINYSFLQKQNHQVLLGFQTPQFFCNRDVNHFNIFEKMINEWNWFSREFKCQCFMMRKSFYFYFYFFPSEITKLQSWFNSCLIFLKKNRTPLNFCWYM